MQSFQLDRKSEKKCYMLAARSLVIAWGDDDYQDWNRIALSDSRLALNFSICFILILFLIVLHFFSRLLVSSPLPLHVLTLFFLLSWQIVHSISLNISYLSSLDLSYSLYQVKFQLCMIKNIPRRLFFYAR